MRALGELTEIQGAQTSRSHAAFQRGPARSKPATSVLEGTLPDPLLSSRSRGWRGLTLELQAFDELDTVVHSQDHVIAVHLGGGVDLRRVRAGQSAVRKMVAGDIAITPVGPPVRWQQRGHSLVILLRVSPAYLRSVATDAGVADGDAFEIQPAFSTRDATIEDLARRLLTALELEGADSHRYADALISQFALHLLQRYTTCAAIEWPRTKLSPHKLRRAVEYINQNLASPLTLLSIANAVSLSTGHFAHAFRATTGVAPHRYIVERRVERAKRLLRESDLPITEIADRIGCASHSHFSVLFHRVTGVSPRQFRTLAPGPNERCDPSPAPRSRDLRGTGHDPRTAWKQERYEDQ